MNMISLHINGKYYTIEDDPATPLLWVLRDSLGLKGTKYGCGIGQCGACSVMVDGVSIRSCTLPVETVTDKTIVTIEGIGTEHKLHPVQEAWIAEDVPQCGYCQSGQIISAVSLLDQNPNPSLQDIKKAMDGNLCRCGTYNRIEKAILRVKSI
ncbi:(2Fe-2S)-binding protein [Flagellimonas olearia]|nr:(2Fe-2S)-binding protein [Allomuricauda olearia]